MTLGAIVSSGHRHNDVELDIWWQLFWMYQKDTMLIYRSIYSADNAIYIYALIIDIDVLKPVMPPSPQCVIAYFHGVSNIK